MKIIENFTYFGCRDVASITAVVVVFDVAFESNGCCCGCCIAATLLLLLYLLLMLLLLYCYCCLRFLLLNGWCCYGYRCRYCCHGLDELLIFF